MYKSFKTMPNALSEIALSCGIMQGCTQVFNRQLLLQLKRHKPNSIAMHDFYITLVCKFIGGKFVMDSTPQISYRQHSANTLGITAKKELHFTNNTATQLKMRSSIKIALHYQTRMKNLLMRLIIIWLMEVPA